MIKFDIKEVWLDMLDIIYCDGQQVDKDGAEIREILGFSYFINNVTELLFDNSLQNVSCSPKLFLDLIEKGAFDIKDYPISGKALADYVASIDDEEVIELEREFVYSYPERLKNIATPASEYGFDIATIDQLEIMQSRLINNSGSNRAVASLYIPGVDGIREDIPCLNHLQAFIRENKLYLYCLFRSNDIYGAFPSNMLFIQNIGLKMTEELKSTYPDLMFGGVNYRVNSAHFYKTDLDAVKNVLKNNNLL